MPNENDPTPESPQILPTDPSMSRPSATPVPSAPPAASPATTAGPAWKAPLAVVLVALAVRFVPGWIAPMTIAHFIALGVGPLLGAVGLLVWWMVNRRVRGRDKWLGLALALGVIVLAFVVAHPTMPQVLVIYGLVLMQAVVVVTLVLTREMAWPERRWLLLAGLVITLWPWALLRQDGQIGELTPELSMRWAPTAEDRFLASRTAESGAGAPAAVAARAEWPGFRGSRRDGKARGVTFDVDWESDPPRELWRRKVGPGWSSFAVAGDLVFTQEQRGAEEVVVAYALADGGEIWTYSTEERFEEPAAGAGPRATPTFDGGTVYAFGARGTLSAVDAASGEGRWRRNLVEDVGAPLPTWGFCSSPLVIGDAVVVFAGAGDDESVVAYRRGDGELLWSAGDGTLSYGSVHHARIGGLDQVLMSTDVGLQAFEPASGELLWEHRWPIPQGARIVQPALLENGVSAGSSTGGSIVLATGYGAGSRRLSVDRRPSGEWAVEEAWTSRYLKPYFNDLVCHEGTCYGFDNKIFTAIGADDGERRWKGGRYGHGQVLLLPAMDVLLVLSEKGEVVLLEATPDAHRELARFQAIEGKTWNHPVVVGDRLLVRNAEEAACFEL